MPRRPGKPDEVHPESLRPDPFARLKLALMRWHFQSFAMPESHGRLTALRHARRGRAQVLAQLLCAGDPKDDLIAMTGIFLDRHGPDFEPNAGSTPAATQGT